MTEANPDFRGRAALLSIVDNAIADTDPRRLIARLARDLKALLGSGELALPASAYRPLDGHYARRELHRSATHGYSVIAMTWAPGQGTPLHDHNGEWCVEGVIQGELEISDYALLESAGDGLHRFVAGGLTYAATGSTYGLSAPEDHHVIRNPGDRETTVSLHIYQGAMARCQVFEPLRERPGWYRGQWRELGVD